jgi:DNA-directed RNA polymerase subunit RPC12/RpoP
MERILCNECHKDSIDQQDVEELRCSWCRSENVGLLID